MKSILISIRPEWVAKILNRKKTIEVRKTAPKCKLPIDVYIYCTKGGGYAIRGPIVTTHYGMAGSKVGEASVSAATPLNGKVVAKFTLRQVGAIGCEMLYNGVNFYPSYCMEDGGPVEDGACLDEYDLHYYLGAAPDGKVVGYSWYISDLVIFDELKELDKFGLKRAPQSWQYVKVEK